MEEVRCRQCNTDRVKCVQRSCFFPFLLAVIKVEWEMKVFADLYLLTSPCMHNNTSDVRKYISYYYRKDKSRIISLLNMSSSPYWVSQWIVMTKEWIVVIHAHSQVRQCTHPRHHCTQDQPQLFEFKQIYTVCILEKKKLLRWQWFQTQTQTMLWKKRHGEWQVKRCCEWLNVQP